MPTEDRMLDWCWQQRAMLIEQLEMMRAGILKTLERQGYGLPMADTTVKSIDRLERQIARLDEVMARFSPARRATSADVGTTT
jgi:hypothetical protein